MRRECESRECYSIIESKILKRMCDFKFINLHHTNQNEWRGSQYLFLCSIFLDYGVENTNKEFKDIVNSISN